MNEWFNLENIETISNSNFVTSLGGAFCGAWAGAWAAQRLAVRSKLIDELLQEIRNTNLATTLAFNVCNGSLNFKKQLIKPIYEDFHKQKNLYEYEIKLIKEKKLPTNHELHFTPDLRSFPLQNLPVLELQKQCCENLSLGNRGLMLTLAIIQTLAGINHLIEKRNALIEDFKRDSMTSYELRTRYFGLAQKHVDGVIIREEYKDTVQGINGLTDDLIFFARLLCKDLYSHGLILLQKYKKISRSNIPKINEVRFGQAEIDGSIPPDSNYIDWINWNTFATNK